MSARERQSGPGLGCLESTIFATTRRKKTTSSMKAEEMPGDGVDYRALLDKNRAMPPPDQAPSGGSDAPTRRYPPALHWLVGRDTNRGRIARWLGRQDSDLRMPVEKAGKTPGNQPLLLRRRDPPVKNLMLTEGLRNAPAIRSILFLSSLLLPAAGYPTAPKPLLMVGGQGSSQQQSGDTFTPNEPNRPRPSDIVLTRGPTVSITGTRLQIDWDWNNGSNPASTFGWLWGTRAGFGGLA